jgi:hypothetical protein
MIATHAVVIMGLLSPERQDPMIQFVGSAATVTKGLRVPHAATGADEILVTTITYDHADRVRSFELLAQESGRP